eukprot:scaffold45751_cov29-Tisochrysis_lutea.AAC.1
MELWIVTSQDMNMGSREGRGGLGRRRVRAVGMDRGWGRPRQDACMAQDTGGRSTQEDHGAEGHRRRTLGRKTEAARKDHRTGGARNAGTHQKNNRGRTEKKGQHRETRNARDPPRRGRGA